MRTILCSRLLVVMAWMGLSGRLRAEVTFAEALDAPGLVWTQSGEGAWVARATPDAHDDADLVEMPDLYLEGGGYPTATLSTQITGPAVVRFWWRKLASVSDARFGIGVDDGFEALPEWYAENGGWTQTEIQLSAGPHTLALRPIEGAGVQVDQVTVTPGAGSLVEAAGDAALSWMIFNSTPWSPSADAPAGVTTSAACQATREFTSVACLIPPDSKIEGWFKLTTRHTLRTNADQSYNYYHARMASLAWRRLRTVAPSRWVTLEVAGGDGSSTPPDFKLAGFSASPASAGDILDAPELTWTQAGSPPFALNTIEAGYRLTGSLQVASDSPFESRLSTQVTGPGRLFFSTHAFMGPEDTWRTKLNEASTDFTQQPHAAWVRHSHPVPAGPVNIEIAAVNVPNPDPEESYGSFYFDDVTFCSAAGAALTDALDLPAGAEMWLRQSSAGLWSRTTAVSRDGVDSLALAASPGARVADLVLPTGGVALTGVWIKSDQPVELRAEPSAPDKPVLARVFTPGPGPDWVWAPIFSGPEATELRLSVPPASDGGQAVFFDGYALYDAFVPASVAVDAPGHAWTGAGLALPGSDAVGESAVLLTGQEFLSTTVPGPFRLKYRYRFCGTHFYNHATIRLGTVTLADLGSSASVLQPPFEWQQSEFTSFTAAPNATLTFECDGGALLVDTVEIVALTDVTFAEALDSPGFTSQFPTQWKAVSGIGHDGTDAAISPSTQGAWLQFNNPHQGAGIDGGFWWRKESWVGRLSFSAGDIQYPTGRIDYLDDRWEYVNGGAQRVSAGWQRVRLHYDRAPAEISWELGIEWGDWGSPTLPAGDAMIDEFSWLAEPQDTFSRALETDLPASTIAISGWNAAGEAVVSVQNTVTWQDGDALEIRATPGGSPSQTTVISSQYHSGNEFSCRVKRGAHPDCALTLLIEHSPYTTVPLTTEWTEFRALLPAALPADRREITFRVTVPNSGPDAVVYIDAVSLQTNTDISAALETNGLTWTGGGNGRQVIDGMFVPASPIYGPGYEGPRETLIYEGYFDGVTFLGPATGPSWMETTMTGPGTAVFTGYVPNSNGGWTARLQVDGITRDTHRVDYVSFRLEAVIGAGSHTVRWVVEKTAQSSWPATPHLHSVAFIPGPPEDALPMALKALSPDRKWRSGGSHPPVPLYSLMEGVTSFDGIFFPALGEGETSWLETGIKGSSQLRFVWNSAAPSACRIDGRPALRATPEPTVNYSATPPAILEIPAGQHTARWEGGTATAELRDFSVTHGSEIADLVASVRPPVIWTTQPRSNIYPWRVTTDGPLSGFDENQVLLEVPGTGLPVLAGADETAGSFLVTGPAVMAYDLRRSNNVPVIVYGNYSFSFGPGDLRWHSEALVIPAGEQRVEFYISEDDSGYEPYVWLRNIRLFPGAGYPDWAASHGLDITNSSPLFDPDNDGQNNLLEFAFGTDPLSESSSALIQFSGTPLDPQLRFPALPYDASLLIYEVQISTDLESWTTVATVAPNPANQSGPLVTLPPSQSPTQFVRVKVRLGG